MYYGVSICLVSFASAMAVVTLNVHFRGLRGSEVPNSVKKVFLGGLAKIVFMQFNPTYNEEKSRESGSFQDHIKVSSRPSNSAHVDGVPCLLLTQLLIAPSAWEEIFLQTTSFYS